MKFHYGIRSAFGGIGIVAAILLSIAFVMSWERPPVVGVQHGFRGTGMEEVYNPRSVKAQLAGNKLPDRIDPVEAAGAPSSTR